MREYTTTELRDWQKSLTSDITNINSKISTLIAEEGKQRANIQYLAIAFAGLVLATGSVPYAVSSYITGQIANIFNDERLKAQAIGLQRDLENRRITLNSVNAELYCRTARSCCFWTMGAVATGAALGLGLAIAAETPSGNFTRIFTP